MKLHARMTIPRLAEFAESLVNLSNEIGFRVSSRGWAYILETRRLINKDDFDHITAIINRCRKLGFLPIDFVAEESARAFQGVEIPSDGNVIDEFAQWLRASLRSDEHYNVDWWEGEKYYIQMVVEKIDLVTLFSPVCEKYHIPIANTKGWSSMLQRAEYAKRFKEAEDRGMKCVLLYYGDHDPDGLRISEFMKMNLYDLAGIRWNNGTSGYDPSKLKIQRFGLNASFIKKHKLVWIDNLITGSKKNLADPKHKNYNMPYVQDYLSEFGEKKCEANSIVTMPVEARKLVEGAIIKILGKDALERFANKRRAITKEFEEYLAKSGLDDTIADAIEKIENRD